MTHHSFLMGAESSGATVPSDVVVLVAATAGERVRLMERVAGSGPVLVVSTVEEAQRILDPDHSVSERVVESPQVIEPSRAAGTGDSPSHQGSAAELTTARGSGPIPSVSLLAAPGMRIHGDRQSLAAGGREIQLTPLEFAMFTALISPLGRVWAFSELCEQVWGTSHVGDASQVHSVIKRLRRKLNDLSAPITVEAVRGVGFFAVGRRPLRAAGPVGLG